MTYYLRNNQEIRGPYSVETIREQLQEGLLTNQWDVTSCLRESPEKITKIPERDWFPITDLFERDIFPSRFTAARQEALAKLEDQARRTRRTGIILLCLALGPLILAVAQLIKFEAIPGEAGGFAGLAVLVMLGYASPILLIFLILGTINLARARDFEDEWRDARKSQGRGYR